MTTTRTRTSRRPRPAGRRAFGLPLDLGRGLTLRWARRADEEALLEFDGRIHSDADLPKEKLVRALRRVMTGDHPTTRMHDFSVVTDDRAGGKIVSSVLHISQTFAYEGIPFGCGRPEAVGTDPGYRRRGLVRAQMEAVHRKSRARSELVQVISGIPWYYRLFGYEMALELGGGRRFFWARPGNGGEVRRELLRWRPALPADIPLLGDLYRRHGEASLVTSVRDDATWRYELEGEALGTAFMRCFWIVTTAEGEPVGYVAWRMARTAVILLELGVAEGRSYREVALFLCRRLREVAADAAKREAKEPVGYIVFSLGSDHPAYRALGPQLEAPIPPYAWYVRVPDLPRFVRLVRPVLERRLAGSPLSGHTGTLRLNLISRHLRLDFREGRIARIGRYRPRALGAGDALFPDETFLRLLFGQRSIGELSRDRADCGAHGAEAEVLLGILFPRRPSCVAGLM